MKFGLAIQKKNRSNINGVENHNMRLKPPEKQLPKEAWFTKSGHHSVVKFDKSKIVNARGLSKRKDAVLGIEFSFQVGNQTEWRDIPTLEHPCGRPKAMIDGKPARDVMEAVCRGAKEAMEVEFGAHNIVSIDLHTDESSPHVHVVVTPITKEGKLQAKQWLNGYDSVAELRARAHVCMLNHIECTYTPGDKGGEPLDESMRAGGVNGPQPQLSWSQKAAAAVSVPKIITELKKQVESYRKELAVLFQKVKRLTKSLSNEVSGRKKDKLDAAAAAAEKARDVAEKINAIERSGKLKITKLQRENTDLMRDNSQLAEQNNELKSAVRKPELKR